MCGPNSLIDRERDGKNGTSVMDIWKERKISKEEEKLSIQINALQRYTNKI